MNDDKKFSFVYVDARAVKPLEKQQLNLGLSFRFEQQVKGTLTERFIKNAA